MRLPIWICVIICTGWCAAQADDGQRTLSELSPVEFSKQIDARIQERLAQEGWQPASACSDAEFIRRAYLDLTGAIPQAADVVQFIEDKSSPKRSALIAKLIASPAHADHLANIWSGWLTPERDDMPAFGRGQNALQTWLRARFMDNLRYDRLVADMLVATGPSESGPTSFFVALDRQPKKIAAQTARVFMGVQLDCAECHDHPFDQWKQRDFWGFAAYFSQIAGEMQPGMPSVEVVDSDSGEVTLPDSDEVVPPKPLVATDLPAGDRGTRRQQLTLWLTTRDNPFLARATVNRVWALLMGRGLIEPVDDMRATQLASHPELLDELSAYFTATGYNLRKLILAITNTQAYSRANQHPAGTAPDELYATMISKPLTERQLAASVAEVARQLGDQSQSLQFALMQQIGRLRGDASQSKLGIVGALVTLHGDILNQVSSEETSRLIKALQAPFLDHQEQVRWLFLTTLSRAPTPLEQQFLSDLTSSTDAPPGSSDDVAATVAADKPDPALQWQSDLLWALLNSSEFAMTP